MNNTIVTILIAGAGVWLCVLTYFVFRIYRLFRTLQKGVEADLSEKGFEEVRNRLNFLEEDGKLHSQKISLLRFNPFDELGGDHSFALAILDGHNSGVVISSLHTRDRTRVYIKEIKKGDCDVQLSGEEKKVLDRAIKKK